MGTQEEFNDEQVVGMDRQRSNMSHTSTANNDQYRPVGGGVNYAAMHHSNTDSAVSGHESLSKGYNFSKLDTETNALLNKP